MVDEMRETLPRTGATSEGQASWVVRTLDWFDPKRPIRSVLQIVAVLLVIAVWDQFWWRSGAGIDLAESLGLVILIFVAVNVAALLARIIRRRTKRGEPMPIAEVHGHVLRVHPADARPSRIDLRSVESIRVGGQVGEHVAIHLNSAGYSDGVEVYVLLSLDEARQLEGFVNEILSRGDT